MLNNARNSNEKRIKLYVSICNECGTLIGTYTSYEEAYHKTLQYRVCPYCKRSYFEVFYDGRPYGFRIEEFEYMDPFEAISSLIQSYFVGKTKQHIFGYEDKGPKSREEYRYPSRRFEFKHYISTERATPAVCINVYDKDTGEIVHRHCFDNQYALLQIALEAIRGAKFLRDRSL